MNDCLAPDRYLKVYFLKYNEEKITKLKDVEKYDCRNLLKSYKLLKTKRLINKLIDPSEDMADNVLKIYLGVAVLFKNNQKYTISDTKDGDLYVDYRFTFE